jgi:DNA-directed RNA polymerase subunit RPC12/RpoP
MQLLCGQCRQTLQVDDSLAGEKYTCPHCGHEISVPFFGGFSDLPAEVGQAPGGPSQTRSRAASPPDDGGEGFADVARQSMSKRIRVVCGKCGKGISVGARFAGKKAKCPACGTRILIPYPDGDQEKQLAAMKSIGDVEEFEQLDEEVVEQDESEAPVDLGPRASERAAAPFDEPFAEPEFEIAAEPVVFPAPAPSAETAKPFVAPTEAPEDSASSKPVVFPPPAPAAARTAAPFVAATQAPEESAATAPVDLGSSAPATVPAAAPAGQVPATPAKPQPRPGGQRVAGKRGPALAVFILLGLIVACGVGVMIAKPELGHKLMALLGPSGTPAPANAPAPLPSQNVAPPPANAPAFSAEPPAIKVDSVSASLFAVDGYFPAPADQVYVKIAMTVTVPAKGEKLLLASDVPFLADGDKQLSSSLGAVAEGKTVVPVQAIKRSYTIEPGASQTMTLLFVVPTTLPRVRLSIRSAEAMVDLPSAPKELPAEAIVGTFVEKPPRNLQPVLRNPVMAAVQNAPNQTLDVRQGKDGFDISVPAAGASGSVTAIRPGLYQGLLKVQNQSLLCRFRLADEGKLLILYMGDEPFHQMTYLKK